MSYLVSFAFWPDSEAVHVMCVELDGERLQPWSYVADTEGNGGMPICVAFVVTESDAQETWDPVLASIEDQFKRLLGKEPGPWVPNMDERNHIKENPNA